ncbi:MULTISPECIES: DISARM system phospholipase D-like protein DrmC [Actinoalloteichus]|uniref:PLD-like domain n=1 Tax=Actinoalloteichus fjordicus TaxID=1612552 RepID=A0AAC9LEF9_9PSEU|nr:MULTISPECIES: DISARM system phospholipase D-like protein DrmC [Actinoalloteichus]APU16137.1 PLD-like domain [Actinoalloteichus fjordicus]APU22200.1 PLD-like domain [Actinoalloteichus sp. GBA129-24]
MTAERFERAVAAAASELGAVRLRSLAAGIREGGPRAALPGLVPVPGFAEAARAVLAAQTADAVPDVEAAAYLRGVAAGCVQQADLMRVESVWSGPTTHSVPVRATAQALVEVIDEAEAELVLVTYSAKAYPPAIAALTAAAGRGVRIAVVVETLRGAGGALGGDEPAAAFAAVPTARLWHWPSGLRPDRRAKMHAKIVIADRRILLLSSANLTHSGAAGNIEAGLVVRGGTPPRRAAEHIAELQANGVLTRLETGVST